MLHAAGHQWSFANALASLPCPAARILLQSPAGRKGIKGSGKDEIDGVVVPFNVQQDRFFESNFRRRALQR